jgi:RNA polymerase-binding transcription factor DksA
MFKEVYVNGGEMEEVKLVEMSQEEMGKIRKQTIANIVKWTNEGFMSKEDFDKNVAEMKITIEELKEAGMIIEEPKQNKNKYRYVLKSTNDSSMKYGVCEVCGQHVSEVFHQIEERHYTIDSLNYEGWTQHDCNSYFGHEECLKSKQR